MVVDEHYGCWSGLKKGGRQQGTCIGAIEEDIRAGVERKTRHSTVLQSYLRFRQRLDDAAAHPPLRQGAENRSVHTAMDPQN
ncbi:hypothetical protein KC343_g57 [Hortaea werneckii]|nr:hypothetical protein KC317_g55 [Hortaea werneckii]KAI7628662.1 hypothetical protein KC346_g59 [Hortaea werneckii]KAI7638501.1 hypothetical protein KC343_g57 [Hortaea werneckii]